MNEVRTTAAPHNTASNEQNRLSAVLCYRSYSLFNPLQQYRLLRLVLLVRDRAGIVQLGQPLQLFEHVVAGARRGRRRVRGGRVRIPLLNDDAAVFVREVLRRDQDDVDQRADAEAPAGQQPQYARADLADIEAMDAETA